jgi:hypothetical protein
MQEYGEGSDRMMADGNARRLMERMRKDSPFEPVSSGLFTEVAIM